ncbi:MAG: hypothetical protein IAE89_11710 [Anaerolineae bacterium]|nr:hypothetical protein [Anaerolineae bacterium]
MKQHITPTEPGAVQRAVNRIIRLPRLARIMLVSLFTLATALLLQPIIDGIYLNYFFPWESTIITDFQRQIPSLITAGMAMLMFVAGWWLLIGFTGAMPQARAAALIYFVAGVVIVFLAIMQLVSGLAAVAPG